MNLVSNPSIANSIEKATTLAELIRSRTEPETLDRSLAELMIDILLGVTVQVDELSSEKG